MVDRAADDKERIVVKRDGKGIVAIVPIKDVEATERSRIVLTAGSYGRPMRTWRSRGQFHSPN
jgi:hypothetical protein